MTTFVFLFGDPNAELYSMQEQSRSPTPNNIQMDDVIRMAENDPIWAHRGKAIQGYAQLESALSSLLADLSGMPRENASTVFYKITNTGSRDAILEQLLRRKYGNKFNPFWNAYFKQLRTINTSRAEIAHWLAAASFILDDANILHVGVCLIHPDSVTKTKNADKRLSKHLIEFQAKCETFARLALMFEMTMNPRDGADPDNTAAWLETFQQPLIYPLPEDHLLNRKPQEPDTPPRSSQA